MKSVGINVSLIVKQGSSPPLHADLINKSHLFMHINWVLYIYIYIYIYI